MVKLTLQQTHFSKCCKDIPSIGNKTFSKKSQTSQNIQPQYSYRCLNNMSKMIRCINNMLKIIWRRNKKVTLKPRDQRPKYNCRKKAECPMEGNCQVNEVVYKCDVTRPLPKKWILQLHRENETAISITASYHLNPRDIPIRQHFHVICGTCFKCST